MVSGAALVVRFGASELLPALSEPQDLQGGWQAGGGRVDWVIAELFCNTAEVEALRDR